MTPPIRPYGTWPSPLSAEMVAGQSLRFGTLQGDRDYVYWSESRPREQGRSVLMRARAGAEPEELLPAPYSARSRVHEYGGGEFLADGDTVYFVNDADQDLYVLTPGAAPERLTEIAGIRFADMSVDRAGGWLAAVAERHGNDGDGSHPENLLAAVPLGKGTQSKVQPLAQGRDFYAAPRFSPDGRTLAWLAWDLPHMPWEAAALYVAPHEGGRLGPARHVAGGDGSAVFQPEWAADGTLRFVWDETGWGNLAAWDGSQLHTLTDWEQELARPLWVFGMRAYAELEGGEVAAATLDAGAATLVRMNPRTGQETAIPCEACAITSLVASGGDIAMIGTSHTQAPAVLRLQPGTDKPETVRLSAEAPIDAADISVARDLAVPREDGAAIHALYYPPTNGSVTPPADALPPVVLTVHGGPTAAAERGLKLKTQYWTSRGFGVCDVDYAGSWGYGRSYRRRLDGQWGIADVADVAAVAEHLAGNGFADPERLLISGGSAGGYTVLMALVTLDLFAAGACYYAVSDLQQLQNITHKFEAGYLYGLIGTEPGQEEQAFAARSPLHQAERISAPVIFLQGADDKVVPPAQSRTMFASLEQRGVPVAYLEFEGEGHGFRQAGTITTALESEYAFFSQMLGLEVPEDPASLDIRNWPR